mmetsp:Transcript_30651/g.59913  ORF Transcript_30651/g.59913 Transcript_30651/m.59913 type:complete len:201 (-) Transcript_30651:15-617(-)
MPCASSSRCCHSELCWLCATAAAFRATAAPFSLLSARAALRRSSAWMSFSLSFRLVSAASRSLRALASCPFAILLGVVLALVSSRSAMRRDSASTSFLWMASLESVASDCSVRLACASSTRWLNWRVLSSLASASAARLASASAWRSWMVRFELGLVDAASSLRCWASLTRLFIWRVFSSLASVSLLLFASASASLSASL